MGKSIPHVLAYMVYKRVAEMSVKPLSINNRGIIYEDISR